METPRIDSANALADSIKAALRAHGLLSVVVSLDPADIANNARGGVVIIGPPEMAFITWDEIATTWTVEAFATPGGDVPRAWAKLDSIIEAMRAGNLNLKSATPVEYRPPQGQVPIPGYSITFNPLDL